MVKCFSITSDIVLKKIAEQSNQSAYISKLVERDIEGKVLLDEIKKLLENVTIAGVEQTVDTSTIMDILNM